MDAERWERLSAAFEAALECEPRERAAVIDRMCDGDTELARELTSLLEDYRWSEGFLETPALGAAASVLCHAFDDVPTELPHDPYPGTTIGNRYRLEGRLGQGGQGRVYLARDLMLMSRQVVVKILPAFGATGAPGRFQHEVEALTRIDHVGVVGVLDAGALPDGAPFLVMQYADGITLRDALESGPVESHRAAAIVQQIGAALEAAHAKGVVHGDVKPENIILQRLDDGTELARLIDFGIARVAQAPSPEPTPSPNVEGTVRYMAPEQFHGHHSRATDVYGLGLVACEMLTGQPDGRELRGRGRVRRLIARALAPRPEDRPDSARDFGEQLARALRPARQPALLFAAATVLLVSIAWALWSVAPGWRQTSDPRVDSLAILPFEMLGPFDDGDHVAIGLADGLITRLSGIADLTVRPTSTIRRFHLSNADPLEAGRSLGVSAVVDGTLQPFAGGIRANVRVIRTADGRALWAGTIESPSRQLLDLEESITGQIAASLRHSNEPKSQAARRGGQNPDAHRLYVEGRYQWGTRTRDGFEKAAEYFRRAIDLDPTYARAHVGLADCFLLLGGYNVHPQLEMLPKAKALAFRALELDPSLGEAHATLGLVFQNLDWDWDAVDRHYRNAIELSPNYATGHHWYAEFLSIVGRFDASRAEFAQARRIDPISPIIQVDEAQLYFFERRLDKSRETLERVAITDPGFEVVQERLAFIDMLEGRDDDAWRRITARPSCRDAASDCRRFWTAYLPGRDREVARAALSWIEQEARSRRIPPFVLVLAHARQGNPGKALDWLEYMVDRHEVSLITLNVNPLVDPIRREPRFASVAARLKLPMAAPF